MKLNQIKPIKGSFIEQAEFYLRNLDRLMDQELDWFIERIEAMKKGDYKRVEYIEKTYLTPLNRKIKEIADRMSRL